MTTDFTLPARTQNNTLAVSDAFSNVRMPPHSQDAEQAVLGGLMLDHLALEKISDVLRPEDFYRADHRKVYEAILDLSEGNKPFDAVMVAEWLS
ncbi:MAG: replicative DNA helicase, partial [Halothiobacillus sp. 14-56-357]